MSRDWQAELIACGMALEQVKADLEDMTLRMTRKAEHAAEWQSCAVILSDAAKKSLSLLEKGAPGWGVSKDLLRAAIYQTKGTVK